MKGKKFVLIIIAVAALLVFILVGKNQQPAPVPSPVASADTPSISPAQKSTNKHRHVHVAANAAKTNAESLLAPEEERERMRRMAENLLKPQMILGPAAALRQRQEWVDRFRKEPNPLLREEIVTEMVQLDDVETAKIMMELMRDEKDAGVRQQLILMLGYLRASVGDMAEVSGAMMTDYQQCNNAEERGRILEAISNLPRPESVNAMQSAFFLGDASAEDRFNAAEGLFKLARGTSVDPSLIQQVTERLKIDAKSATTEQERLMAARALAAPGQDNKTFLGSLLATETSPKIRDFLELASQQYPTR